jgi:hypothetical protein
MSTTKLQNEIVEATSMTMKGLALMEDICAKAIKEGKGKPNQSDWVYFANHISAYVNYQLQKKEEELNEKAHECLALAQQNHKKSGSATYHSENEQRHRLVCEAIGDMQRSWTELCKNFSFRTDWNDLNQQSNRTDTTPDEINQMREAMNLQPLEIK